jgi:hypothetical protein
VDLTFRNPELETEATVRVGAHGMLTRHQVARLRRKLTPDDLAPAGSAARKRAGHLGEHGPQEAAPGWLYEITPLPDGGALLEAEQVNGRGKRGRKART